MKQNYGNKIIEFIEMKPIQDILNRIKWDRHFRGRFDIGYYDRIEDKILIVPFKEVQFPEENHFIFEIEDEEGSVHTIPYHRVREVYKNGELIWKRSK